MKFEDIKKANETIITTDIKGKDYAEVAQRVKAFRMVYPNGFIKTELLKNDDGICIFKATAGYTMHMVECDDVGNTRTLTDKEYILGTGTAFEKQDSTFINKTSYIENCETSAVGRALGFCGFGIDTSIASKEELEEQVKIEEETNNTIIKIKKLMGTKKVLPDELHDQFQKNSADMDLEELKEVVKWLESK